MKRTSIVTIAEDRRSVVLAFPRDSEGIFRVSTEEVDFLLRALDEYRRCLVPDVPADFPAGQVEAFRCEMRVSTDSLAGDPVLHIRHMGFGWLHFIMDRERAREIAGQLEELADLPAPQMRGLA